MLEAIIFVIHRYSKWIVKRINGCSKGFKEGASESDKQELEKRLKREKSGSKEGVSESAKQELKREKSGSKESASESAKQELEKQLKSQAEQTQRKIVMG